MADKNEARSLIEGKALSAVLALMVAEREERLNPESNAPKTEVVLASAGLTAAEIAQVVGKNYDSVRKTLQRAKASGKVGSDG